MAGKTRRVNARAHGIEFTDADWERIQIWAAKNDMSPAAVVNQLVGNWYKTWVENVWDGLTTHGGRRAGAGRPPKSRGKSRIKKEVLDNQDAT